MAFLSQEELNALGFRYLGKNVKISNRASIYNYDRIEIGDNSRVDDFCLLSGSIKLGRNVHIGAYTQLAGGTKGITFEDFSGTSYAVQVFTQIDDYSGRTLFGPTVPEKYRDVFKKEVLVEKYCAVGAGAIIFAGVVLAEGTSVGAMSLVLKSTEPWGIYVGVPARKLKDRDKGLLTQVKAYLASEEDR